MVPKDYKGNALERNLTTTDFVDALQRVVRPDSTWMRMLQFHYGQPKRTTTPEAVSAEFKYKNPNGANLPYAQLGRHVGKRLRWKPKYPIKTLVHLRYPEPERKCHWEMRGRLAAALEALGWVSDAPTQKSNLPESVMRTEIVEGALRRMAVNAYERSRKAREACLAHYGTLCMLCGFNFGAVYGPAARGFIHVHHIAMIKEKGGKKYKIDPIRDLRPVCPNCHSVIHIRREPYTIAEVRQMVSKHRPADWIDPPEVREARLRQPAVRFLGMTPEQS